jgi:HEPN domain-containing protein
MPPEEASVGTAQAWLRRAKSNLALARQPKPDETVWEDLCFDAEQAVERAFKAVLVFRGIDFPRTHNITIYATVCRYPGEAEPVTEHDYREAVALAEKVVRWAERMLSASSVK